MSFKLSPTTLAVLENYSKITSLLNSDSNIKKLKLKKDSLEVKIQGLISFYDAQNEENEGFDEIIITDSKQLLDIIKKFGLNDAEFKDPFIYIKNGNNKIKYHTGARTVPDIKRDIVEVIKEKNPLTKPFEINLNNISEFLTISKSLGYQKVKIETKSGIIRLTSEDLSGVDAGFYEYYLGIKSDTKFSISINKQFLDVMINSRYEVTVTDFAVVFESKDIEGLVYYISVLD